MSSSSIRSTALTRSRLADFAKLVELFDAHGVSFVSVTQQVQHHDLDGPATSTCFLLPSFEREVTFRANPRQDRGIEAKGALVGAPAPRV